MTTRLFSLDDRRTVVLDHVTAVALVPPYRAPQTMAAHGWKVVVGLSGSPEVHVHLAPGTLGDFHGPTDDDDEDAARALYEALRDALGR